MKKIALFFLGVIALLAMFQVFAKVDGGAVNNPAYRESKMEGTMPEVAGKNVSVTGSTIGEEGTGTTSKGKMKSGDYVINVNWKMQGNTGTGLTSTGMMMRDAVSHPIRVGGKKMGEMKDKMMTGTGQKMKDTVMIKKQARIDEMKVKVKKIFEKVKDEKLVKILEKIAAIKIKISANTKLSDDKKSSLLEQVEAIEGAINERMEKKKSQMMSGSGAMMDGGTK